MDNSVNGILDSHSIIVDSNTFINTVDIAPEDLTKFTKELTEIKRSLTNIFKEQTTLSIQIYSRKCTQSTVTKTHDAWAKELQELATKITKCDLMLRGEQDKLPHFDSNYAIILNWIDISKQQQTLYFLNKTNEELKDITNSPAYKQALELYRKVIKQCGNLQKNHKNLPINELQELITETSLAIAEQKKEIESILNHKLKKEIETLHSDTLDDILYTISSYPEGLCYETSPRQKLIQTVCDFIGGLKKNR